MRGFNSVLLLFFIFCFQNMVVAEQIIKIRVQEFPPNYYKSKTGNWTGLGVELSSKIVETAGFKPVFEDIPWSRALKYMEEGEIQYMTNIHKTDERSKFMNWIGPIRQGEMRLIVKKGNENLPIKSLDDFIAVSKNKNSKFGYQTDVSYTEEFKRRMDNDPEFQKGFEPVSSGELNFKKIISDRIVGSFETTISAVYMIKNDPDYKELALHPFVLRKTPVYHGVSKKGVDKATLKKLLNAFKTLQKNGELQRIINSYKK